TLDPTITMATTVNPRRGGQRIPSTSARLVEASVIANPVIADPAVRSPARPPVPAMRSSEALGSIGQGPYPSGRWSPQNAGRVNQTGLEPHAVVVGLGSPGAVPLPAAPDQARLGHGRNEASLAGGDPAGREPSWPVSDQERLSALRPLSAVRAPRKSAANPWNT